MKKSLLFLLLFCFQTSLLIAQVPSGMNYSAIVRNTNGEIRANQVYLENPRGITLDSDGNIVISEKHKIRKIKK